MLFLCSGRAAEAIERNSGFVILLKHAFSAAAQGDDMSDENQLRPEGSESRAVTEVAPTPLHAVFFNPRGLRAGWRLAIYLALVVMIVLALNLALDKIFHLPKTSNPAPWQFFLSETLSFLVVFLPALVMSKIERRPAGAYGLPLDSFLGRRFWQGCVFGLAEVAVLMALIAVFHGYSFGALDLHGVSIFKWALFWGFFFVVVGLFEEFAFRGYLQFTLADGIGFWPAALLLSTLFGAVHLHNKGEGPVGAASVVMIGLVFALALKRTGNLWFVVGWHAAYDFGETYLFSVPNSGNVFPGHLSSATLQGGKWLTGGTVGPEGSVFSFLTMAVAAFLVHKIFPPRQSGQPAPAASSSDSVNQV
jgi:CAAX protease family protein